MMLIVIMMMMMMTVLIMMMMIMIWMLLLIMMLLLIITISANLLIVGTRADACVLGDCCSLHHIGDLIKNLEVFGLLGYQGHHLVVVALGLFHHVAQDLVGPLLHHSDGRSGDA